MDTTIIDKKIAINQFVKEKAYWKNMFTNTWDISTIYPDKISQRQHQIKEIGVQLSTSISNCLFELCKNSDEKIHIVLISALAVLLAKYQNCCNKVLIGTTIDNQEYNDNIINTILPLSIPLDERNTFNELLVKTSDVVREAIKHQNFPIEYYAKEQGIIEKENGLFNIALILDNIQNINYLGQSKLDLLFVFNRNKEQVNGKIMYNSFKYEKGTIVNICNLFDGILEKVLVEKGVQLKKIDFLRTVEIENIRKFNSTELPYYKNENLCSTFRNVADKSNKEVALVFGYKSLSYDELDQESNKVAYDLLNKCIKPSSIVSIILENSENLLISMLGILKAGCTILPIDPGLPGNRKKFMLNDANVKLIISNKDDLRDDYNDYDIIDIQEILSHDEQEVLEVEIESSSPAYVLYTSGSTGKPKGSIITHQNLLNYVQWAKKVYNTSEGLNFPLYTSISFDLTMTSIFVPLLSGNTVYIQKMGEISDVLFNILNDKRINIVKLTPSHLKIINSIDIFDTSIQKIIVGGEKLNSVLSKEIFTKFKEKVSIINEYGPTETTIGCMIHLFSSEKDEGLSVPIGKPAGNVKIYLLDNSYKMIPKGSFGEIYIGGDGVSMGYINRPELTADRFMQNPYNPNEKLYRSGDLARMNLNNDLEFFDRIDNQIKINGYRIELGEIESTLLKVKDIKDAAVVLHQNGEENKNIYAYYVSSKHFSSDRLREILMTELPSFMLPDFCISIDQIPLNNNGKLDKHKLPLNIPQETEQIIKPRNKIEKEIIDVWADILNINKDSIGINSNFFKLGGDSIKSIQISSRIRSIGYDVSVNDIITSQTIGEISKNIKKIERQSNQAAVVGEFPLTPIQQWFFNGPVKGKHHYNQSFLLQFTERILKEDVSLIFNKIQEHHDALRITFVRQGEGYVQENKTTDMPLALVEKDLTKENEPEETLFSLCNSIQSTIDLEEGPLMKLGLFHLKDGSRLLIVIHHLVMDGVSWRILFEDLETLYLQIKNNEKLSLPPKTDSYKEWSNQTLKYKDSVHFKSSIPYWNTVLANEIQSLPIDHPNVDNLLIDRKSISVGIDQTETNSLLTKVNTTFNTEISDILLTAVLLSINDSFNVKAIKVDLESHGRHEIIQGINISRTIGWFTSIYPIILEKNSADLNTIIKEIKENIRNVPNKGIDYLIRRFSSSNPLSEESNEGNPKICFNYLGQFDSDMERKSYNISEERKGEEINQNEHRNYELEFSGVVVGGKLWMKLTYGSKQFKKDTIEALMKCYKDKLTEIIEYCSQYNKTELTPSDFTYKALDLKQCYDLQAKFDFEDIYPLSPLQEGILFHDLYNPESEYYFEQISYHIKGVLDIETIEKSINTLISRYTILRTAFFNDIGGRSMQIVLKERKISLLFIDVRNEIQISHKQEVILIYQKKDKQKKFDLQKDALMRLTVLQTAMNEYVFIWSYHHILMDGWSMGILLNEFYTIYQNYRIGQSPSLHDIQPYAKYIDWLEKREKADSLLYWKAYLENYNVLTSLPKKQNNGDEVLTYKLERKELQIHSNNTGLLRNISEKYGITINTIIQCAWGLLLAKYNNTNDVVFGSVVSGRSSEVKGIEKMVGLFINAIPVRIQVKKDMELHHLLEKVQELANECQGHHFNPLAKIQSQTELGKGLLDHIFVFENYPIVNEIEKLFSAHVKNDFSVDNVQVFELANYDFSIIIVPSDEINIRVDYNGNRYEGNIIEQVLTHLNQIINHIIRNTSSLCSSIDILTEKEKQDILIKLNNTKVDYPKEKKVTNLFEDQAKKLPNKIALVQNDKLLTYEKINERAIQLASMLLNNNVQCNECVGIYADKSIEAIIAILAVLKIGAVYLPLELDYPEERIKYMLRESMVNTVLVQGKPQDKLWDNFNCININELPNASLINIISNYNVKNNLAYVMYTSGSTGKPKGVIIPQKSIIRLVKNQNYVELDESTKILLTGAMVFDATTFEIWGSLLNGGTLCFADKNSLLTTQFLGEILINHRINTMWLTSSLFNQHAQTDAIIFQKLKFLLVGGEVLNPIYIKKIKSLYPKIQIINGYGPTENTTFSTSFNIGINCPDNIPIGEAISNSTSYVFDRNEKLQPVGAVGELYVGGDGVALGYLNNVELTHEKFVSNPYIKGELLYRTGDMVRLLPDGNLSFIGRLDKQIKIRGFRIELKEIENQLEMHNRINEAVVTIFEKDTNKYIVAYYISDKEIKDSELRDFFEDRLPNYMVPNQFVHLDKLPLTTNGKLDRAKLPEIEFKSDESHTEPQTKEEKILIEVWSQVLNVENIGITDNFFMLGGDSIKTILISSKLHNYGYKISVADIFRFPAIKDLAKNLTRIENKEYQIGEVKEIALSPIQKWFFDLDWEHKHHFNQSFMLFSRDGFNHEAIKKSFQFLVKHHEMLRTNFKKHDHEVLQCFLDYSEDFVQLKVLNLSGIQELTNRIKDEADKLQASLDLNTGPLIKLDLFSTDTGDHLLIVIHHLIVDGVSWRIMLEDLAIHYNQIVNNQEIVAPPKTDPYHLWIKQLKSISEQPKVLKEIDYWEKIDRAKLDHLKKDFSIEEKERKVKFSEYVGFTLSKSLTSRLTKESHKAFNTEINDLLLTAFLYSLFDWQGTKRILINMEGHGRDEIGLDIDISRTIGWFTSQFPVLLELRHKDMAFAIKHVKETMRRIPNKGIIYGILKYITPKKHLEDRLLSSKPEISFNYLGEFDDKLIHNNTFQISSMPQGITNSPDNSSIYPVSISGFISNGKLQINISYNKKEFERKSIEALSSLYKSYIEKIVEFCTSNKIPEKTPSDFNFSRLSLEEFDTIVNNLNQKSGVAIDDISLIYPLSPMQKGMLFHSLMSLNSELYFEQNIFYLKGEVNKKYLEKSFNEVINRYNILRTIFINDNLEEPVQVVLKERQLVVNYIEITDLNTNDREDYLIEFITEDRKVAFDLEKDLLFRVHIIKYESDEFCFIWDYHHILLDGWDISIIYRDIMAVYYNLLHGNKVEPKKSLVQYDRFIEWIEDQDHNKALNYWKEYLNDYEVIDLLSGISLVDFKSGFDTKKFEISLSKETTDLIHRLCHENSVTVNTFLQVVWGILLHKYNKCDDVVFGTVVSGRPPEIEGIEDMVGLFINAIPVRIKVNENESFLETLVRIQHEMLNSKHYEYITFSEIQAIAGKQNMIDHLIGFENYPINSEFLNMAKNYDCGFRILRSELIDSTNYKLMIIGKQKKVLSIEFKYNQMSFEERKIKNLASHFCNLIQNITKAIYQE